MSLHFFIGSLGSSPLKDHTLKIMLDKTEPMILTLLYKTFYYCHSGGGTNAILSGIKGENSEHECGRCNKDNSKDFAITSCATANYGYCYADSPLENFIQTYYPAVDLRFDSFLAT